MSKRVGERYKFNKIFTLDLTPDPVFRYRCQLSLPPWSLEDFELRRWIVGFGDNVMVKRPVEIINQIKLMGNAISQLYL